MQTLLICSWLLAKTTGLTPRCRRAARIFRGGGVGNATDDAAARNNVTQAKAPPIAPPSAARKHEPGDAHASPGTAATATMAGPRNV